MTDRVVVTATAEADLTRYDLRAAETAPATAAAWLDRFERSLAALAEHPQRCPPAPEHGAVDDEIRQLSVGRRRGADRVLFAISEDDHEVGIPHIRRGAMAPAGPDDRHG